MCRATGTHGSEGTPGAAMRLGLPDNGHASLPFQMHVRAWMELGLTTAEPRPNYRQ
ncbi:hypothetical protein GCM10027589_06410 [Actinocorallia lasiicapitis]